MHEKAVFLALHGLVLMEFGTHIEGRPPEYRIKRQRRMGEWQLSWSPVSAWHVDMASTLDDYTAMPWTEVPDKVMDRLSQKMMDEFVGRL